MSLTFHDLDDCNSKLYSLYGRVRIAICQFDNNVRPHCHKVLQLDHDPVLAGLKQLRDSQAHQLLADRCRNIVKVVEPLLQQPLHARFECFGSILRTVGRGSGLCSFDGAEENTVGGEADTGNDGPVVCLDNAVDSRGPCAELAPRVQYYFSGKCTYRALGPVF